MKRIGRYLVDVEAGIVYGRFGRPVGSMTRTGYLQVFRGGADGRSIQAHILVWTAEHGPIPDGLEINHRNGVKTDNRIANLELVTRSDNLRHAYALGLRERRTGERGPNARLTWEIVRSIRQRITAGERRADLAAEHGVHLNTVNLIAAGKTWKEAA